MSDITIPAGTSGEVIITGAIPAQVVAATLAASCTPTLEAAELAAVRLFPRQVRPVLAALLETSRDEVLPVRVSHAVGHADTAAVMGRDIGLALAPGGRVQLDTAAVLLVGAYVGPRLPEGATTLPAGAEISWFLLGVGRHAAGRVRRAAADVEAAERAAREDEA